MKKYAKEEIFTILKSHQLWLHGEALKSYAGKVELFGYEGWSDAGSWTFIPHLVCRAKPKPVTKPSINWDHVHPDYKWMATDDSGETHLFIDEPEPYDFTWVSYDISAPADSFASFKSGDCDWKDSLVRR